MSKLSQILGIQILTDEKQEVTALKFQQVSSNLLKLSNPVNSLKIL